MAEDALTGLQHPVVELFFDLAGSDGFVLAGGAALVASGLTQRPTQDVDLFGSDVAVGITGAGDALEVAVSNEGGRPSESTIPVVPPACGPQQ